MNIRLFTKKQSLLNCSASQPHFIFFLTGAVNLFDNYFMNVKIRLYQIKSFG